MASTPETDGPVADRGPILERVLWSLTALAVITTALRLAFRARNRVFGWDDVFMFLSLVRKPAYGTLGGGHDADIWIASFASSAGA